MAFSVPEPRSDLVYLDHAATTPVRPEVLELLTRLTRDLPGNASSVYSLGRAAKNVLDEAREIVAEALAVEPGEIFFTSGGTESDNWAVRGAAEAAKARGKHLITSSIEHPAVLHVFDALEKEGYRVTRLPVTPEGEVLPETLEAALTPDTTLVSIQAANNEVGTLQDLRTLAELCHRQKTVFHTDAVQLVGTLPLRPRENDLDLASISSHKLYGPKGVGALYLRRGTKIRSVLEGGGQERTRRPGTENVPAIAAFAEALRLAVAEQAEEAARLRSLRDSYEELLKAKFGSDVLFNGHPEKRLPHISNVCFPGIEGETLLLLLDSLGFCCSSGSACTSGSLEASPVLLALGRSEVEAKGSLRVSLGRSTTKEELTRLVGALDAVLPRLRSVKP